MLIRTGNTRQSAISGGAYIFSMLALSPAFDGRLLEKHLHQYIETPFEEILPPTCVKITTFHLTNLFPFLYAFFSHEVPCIFRTLY